VRRRRFSGEEHTHVLRDQGDPVTRLFVAAGIAVAAIALLAVLDVSANWIGVISGLLLGVLLPATARGRRRRG